MMTFHRTKNTLLAASIGLILAGCSSSDDPAPSGNNSFAKPANYAGFPVTLKDAPGSHASSEKYTGQMARQVLRESVKAVVKAPGTTDTTATTALVNLYLKDDADPGTTIIAPADKAGFDIKEITIGEVGSGQLYSKTFDTSSSQADPIPGVLSVNANITMGVPGTKTAREVLDLWVADFANNNATTGDAYVNMTTGYDYNQLFPKFLMGAVFYNQAVDKYLDEYINTAGTKDNNVAYNENADTYYTGKEHSWDEGFGYWGAAANYGTLTAEQNYRIKKQTAEHFAAADFNSDNMVSLYDEYTSGPAYYAASFDRDDNGSTYGADMMDAWLTGRTLIANAVDADGDARLLTDTERASLVSLAKTIQDNWEMVLAEAVHKYAGNSYSTLATLQLEPANTDKQKAYYKQWGEMKGFMLSLQYGGTESKIDKATFEEIDNLIGFGPVLADGSQVSGVTGTTFDMTAGSGNADNDMDAYQVMLKEVQTRLDTFYTLKAKQSLILP